MVGQMLRLLVLMNLLLLAACASSNQPEESAGNQQIMQLQSEAEKAYKLAMLDQAESLYLQVLASVPNYAPAWFRLGNIYTRTGRQEAAITAYLKCLSLEPSNQKVFYNISLVRLKQSTEVLSAASRQGAQDTALGRQIQALLSALNQLQSEPSSKSERLTQLPSEGTQTAL
jgi:tetratricopeptide (TPR) repeat protein